ncbi:hypothetical protein [Arthrobacter sp. zg-Y1143]|uniref:hypothetical protein n=1 Tax=Arthrobacter sp. zg-Y1143 TaxID=3049065 RepID=UPI0024C30098|nr:hypothetical protein [Arthrobacter sp. zg-Y1143]MDK1329075.1 hypothetical protein [Arthrobacter sp. zg-Y1143]
MSFGAVRQEGQGTFAVPAALWSAILLAAPFLSFAPAAAWPWGVGAALLLGVFPTVLIATLRRRCDLRLLPPSSLPPAVLGAAALAGMTQWAILWLDGPLALSAAAFGLITSAVVLMIANCFASWDWLDVSLGAGVVITAAEAYLLLPGGYGPAAAVVPAAGLGTAVALRFREAAPHHNYRFRRLAAAAAGALAGGGVFLWLLSHAR